MTLVSILGDFHSSILPIFFEFKEQLKHHIILHDDSEYDKEQIKKLLQSQKNFLVSYEKDGEKVLDYKIDHLQVQEDNYDDMIKAFKLITTISEESEDIYLNSTDGLNSLSIVLSNKILEYSGNVIAYDRYANTYNLHTKNGIKKIRIQNNIDIKNHLKLKGYKLLQYSNKFTLNKRKNVVLGLTKSLKDYKKFATTYPNHDRSYNYYESLLEKADIPKNKKKMFLDGGVFEEYIYWLIKDNFDIDDIMTGVLIEFNEGFTNEIDILFIKNNHLHFIECKFTSRFKGSEYIYKQDSIKDYLDDDGKGMILTIGNANLFTNGDKIRAYNNNILLHAVDRFNEEKFLEDVKNWFNL